MPKLRHERLIEYQECLFAKCNKKTEINKRKRVTSEWQLDAIRLINKMASNQNEYLCHNCYFNIFKYINSHADFEHFLEKNASKAEIQDSQCFQCPKEPELNFETISEKRCFILTGLFKQQFEKI